MSPLQLRQQAAEAEREGDQWQRWANEAEHPKDGHVYRSKEDGSYWSFVGRWKHPSHRPYHVGWNGEYAIVQANGNFKNELQFVLLAEWDDRFELAWEPLKVCQFCGFSRMRPCLTRQTCANLTDYRLEPDEPDEDPAEASA